MPPAGESPAPLGGVVDLGELGSTGLKRFAGYVDEEFHPDLKGSKAAKVYREMADNHPVVGAILLLVDLLIRQTPKFVEATGSSPDHLRAKFLCETALDDLDGGIDDVITDALTFTTFGYSTLEKVFKIRRGNHPLPEFKSKHSDGMIGWRKLAQRGQEALDLWDFGPNGEIKGFWQLPPPDYQRRYIPRSKFLHFRFRSPKGNPEGRSALRSVYTPYYFQKHLEFVEAVGIERNLAGLPYINVPLDVLQAKSADAIAALASYKLLGEKVRVDQRACVIMPPEEDRNGKTGYKFSLLSTAGKSNAETDPVIRRKRSEVAMGLFGEFILVGMEKAGSWSLHSDKTDMFALGVGAYLEAVQQEFTNDGFPELCELNGIPRECAPKYCHGDIKAPDLEKLATFISNLTGQGVIAPSESLERHVLEAAGLPPPEPRVAASPAPVVPPVV